MFLGGASICRGSEACRTKVHPLKRGADLTAAVMLAGVLGGWLLGRRGSTGQSDTGQDGIFYGDRVGMTFDDGRVETTDALLVLTTTLERLVQDRSEEHTSELQSLMRLSYAVFCLKNNRDSYEKRQSDTNSNTTLVTYLQCISSE